MRQMKYNKRKLAVSVLLSVAMAFGGSFASFADWQQDGLGWWYENEDGTYPVNTWYEDEDGDWYFFNEQGYMISNCYHLIDGSIYPFDEYGIWNGCVFSDLYPGVWTGNAYVNEWTGLHLNIPEGFPVTTAVESGGIGESSSFIEGVIWTPDGTNSGIEIEYLDALNFERGENTSAEYIVSMRSVLLALSGYTIDGVSTVTLGGKEYVKLSTNFSGLMKQDLYCRKVGTHYFECLTALYWLASEPSVNMLLNSIY